MTISEKLERLIENSGWSIAEVARRIGREGEQQLLRWMDRLPPSRPRKENPKPRKDGRPRRERDKASPSREDLIGLSDLFHVDIRWLIDDRLGWDDQLKADNPILVQIRRLPMEDQLAMWTWHSSRGKDNGTQPGSTSHPKEKPPTRPHRNDGGQTKRGMNAIGN